MTPKHLSRGLLPVDVLALTLHHEAGGEGRAGMVDVGHTIVNRARRRQQSIADVCLARKQFSCWAPDEGAANHRRLVEHANLIRVGRTPRVLAEAYAVAGELLAGHGADTTNGADHYYAPAAMQPAGRVPSWAAGVTPCKVSGRHVFFNLEGGTA